MAKVPGMEIGSLLLPVVAVLVAGVSALCTRRQAAEAGKVTAAGSGAIKGRRRASYEGVMSRGR